MAKYILIYIYKHTIYKNIYYYYYANKLLFKKKTVFHGTVTVHIQKAWN